jgi:hypothetical protein
MRDTEPALVRPTGFGVAEPGVRRHAWVVHSGERRVGVRRADRWPHFLSKGFGHRLHA